LIVALVGLYAAVHLGSWEKQLIEDIGDSRLRLPVENESLWWLSVAATALVPLVLLLLGIRDRRYPLLIVGAGTAVASLVTLRWYVHLASLWVVITASGAALVGLVLGLRHWLDSGPGKERRGFTAEPLFQDIARQRILEMGAAVVSLSPEARNVHEEPKFEGGGGQFGGGGSSAEFERVGPYPPSWLSARRISGWLGSISRDLRKLPAAPAGSLRQRRARPAEAWAKALVASAVAASKSARACWQWWRSRW
jgi:hypothetical protein